MIYQVSHNVKEGMIVQGVFCLFVFVGLFVWGFLIEFFVCFGFFLVICVSPVYVHCIQKYVH